MVANWEVIIDTRTRTPPMSRKHNDVSAVEVPQQCLESVVPHCCSVEMSHCIGTISLSDATYTSTRFTTAHSFLVAHCHCSFSPVCSPSITRRVNIAHLCSGQCPTRWHKVLLGLCTRVFALPLLLPLTHFRWHLCKTAKHCFGKHG